MKNENLPCFENPDSNLAWTGNQDRMTEAELRSALNVQIQMNIIVRQQAQRLMSTVLWQQKEIHELNLKLKSQKGFSR